MRRLYRVSCCGCGAVFRALSVERLGAKVAKHCCWRAA